MINDQISDFSGDFRFLSNFDEHDGCDIVIDGVLAGQKIVCKNVESAYQALKTIDPLERYNIATSLTPGHAKRLGKKVQLRPDWEQVKLTIMYDLLMQKFSYPYYKELLLSTGDATLIEGNTWGDTFWGICDGIGLNWLGELLMQIREGFKND